MTEELYRLALATLQRHLEAAGVRHAIEDGDLVFNDHRLSLSIGFDDFVQQGEQVIAPVDVQLHVDGDDGSRFRMGTLGVGESKHDAMLGAIEEWHVLAGSAVLAALGAPAGSRLRQSQPQEIAGWWFYPGRAGVRGNVPEGLQPRGNLYRRLIGELRRCVLTWKQPHGFALRSIFVMHSSAEGASEVQAAVDGFVNEELTKRLQALAWPTAGEPYLFKQLFVFRTGD